ncbi:MAG: hypothetical protein U0694_05215 [Anaerolineae bacterium]
MSVTVQWLDEQNDILIYELYGKWTWHEFYGAFEKARGLMASVPHTVYAITIARDDNARHHIPPHILTHFPIITRKLPPNAGTAAMVVNGFNPIWRSMYNAVVKLYPPFGQRVRMVPSEMEAVKQLSEIRTQEKLSRTA